MKTAIIVLLLIIAASSGVVGYQIAKETIPPKVYYIDRPVTESWEIEGHTFEITIGSPQFEDVVR